MSFQSAVSTVLRSTIADLFKFGGFKSVKHSNMFTSLSCFTRSNGMMIYAGADGWRLLNSRFCGWLQSIYIPYWSLLYIIGCYRYIIIYQSICWLLLKIKDVMWSILRIRCRRSQVTSCQRPWLLLTFFRYSCGWTFNSLGTTDDARYLPRIDRKKYRLTIPYLGLNAMVCYRVSSQHLETNPLTSRYLGPPNRPNPSHFWLFDLPFGEET